MHTRVECFIDTRTRMLTHVRACETHKACDESTCSTHDSHTLQSFNLDEQLQYIRDHNFLFAMSFAKHFQIDFLTWSHVARPTNYAVKDYFLSEGCFFSRQFTVLRVPLSKPTRGHVTAYIWILPTHTDVLANKWCGRYCVHAFKHYTYTPDP